jgi:hypothetical protein
LDKMSETYHQSVIALVEAPRVRRLNRIEKMGREPA